MAERQLQAWEADQQEAEEEEEARQAEQLTNALLQQEAKMMAKQGYRPKVGSLRGRATLPSPSAWPLLSRPVHTLCPALLPSSWETSLLSCMFPFRYSRSP